MKTMYIMCGLPGSGKSTWARKCVEKDKNTIIISKDAIRTMINGKYVFDQDREVLVKEIVQSIISGLKLNVNIIFDETNITSKKRQDLVFLAHQYGYSPIIVYCKGNGNNLENRIMDDSRGYTKDQWEKVIENMAAAFEKPDGSECEYVEAPDEYCR
jgi:predicted kinase